MNPQGDNYVDRHRGPGIIVVGAAIHGQPARLGHPTALGQRARCQVLPSVGTFGYEPQPGTLSGLVRGIEVHGLYMSARASA